MILNIALASVILVCLGILVIAYISHKHHKPGYGISLLVPFRSDNGRREETWNWLREYWHHELPGAEIIVGTNDDTPFCKTMAFNQAANKARGDVFVLMDADCYLPGSVVIDCANEIRRERKRGNRIWFIPYRWFYRLNSSSSQAIINSDYRNP
ncbi:MAG: glycosyltransferase, partial [Candidatus Saccharimonadales bacterium]